MDLISLIGVKGVCSYMHSLSYNEQKAMSSVVGYMKYVCFSIFFVAKTKFKIVHTHSHFKKKLSLRSSSKASFTVKHVTHQAK